MIAQAVGINYAPCLISTSARGFDATAAGVNFQPNVIEILAEGLAVWPQAVNIQPALIYINPWGLNVRCDQVLPNHPTALVNEWKMHHSHLGAFGRYCSKCRPKETCPGCLTAGLMSRLLDDGRAKHAKSAAKQVLDVCLCRPSA